MPEQAQATISEAEMLSRAVAFEVFPHDTTNRRLTFRDGQIDNLSQVVVQMTSRHPEAWAVKMNNLVLSKSADGFIFELSPSSRDEKHLSDTRFASAAEAISFAKAHVDLYEVKYAS